MNSIVYTLMECGAIARRCKLNLTASVEIVTVEMNVSKRPCKRIIPTLLSQRCPP